MIFFIAHPQNLKKITPLSQVNVRSLKYYFMEDDGGSYLTSPVDSQIKQAVRSVSIRLECASVSEFMKGDMYMYFICIFLP